MPNIWVPCATDFRKLPRLAKLVLLVSSLSAAAWSQGMEVDFQGKVVDRSGAPIPGATVKLLESALSATTDAQGAFALKGTVANGVIRHAALPGKVKLRYRDGILTLDGPALDRLRAEWLSPDGSVRIPASGGAASGSLR